ncbi:hypothetical protein MUCCIDRAFT_78914 [Mucor lusitanicus CBS 277.49]|uniref:Uncharacterized protein n=1 Tax=Mucor lusitanicus CBS 277.49 TaxID=747725 RepID=A0A168NAJ7_MUCCL|nr:hypothetical protein MUCCIDRAFT_78914 [Mucor lusitanicus CBS 277.49]
MYYSMNSRNLGYRGCSVRQLAASWGFASFELQFGTHAYLNSIVISLLVGKYNAPQPASSIIWRLYVFNAVDPSTAKLPEFAPLTTCFSRLRTFPVLRIAPKESPDASASI